MTRTASYFGVMTSVVTPRKRTRGMIDNDAETALHPSRTARMGVDDQSVLDPLTPLPAGRST